VIVRAGFLTEGQYPVILSLENHLSVNQQDTLAEIFEEKFGERLPPRFDRGDDAVLPSPESLAGKILLKGGVCNETTPPQDKSARLSSMIHLGTYSVPKTADFAEKPAFLMFSASETRIEKFANDPVAHQKLRAHNAIHLTRSFPKGSRVGSSNYDPCPGWNTGAQIVALNYQTASEPMWLNEAKFTMNRGRGYVLKPPYIIDPTIPPPGEANPELLKILVIRGGGFPSSRRDIIDPYIELKVVGWKEDTKSQKTKTVRNNGLDPNWGVEFEFPLRAPEMDLLCIYLWDGDAGGDDLVGHFVVPVPAIRPGLRSIPLYDGSRERVRFKGAFVLCNFTKT
jgi:hypothetical protein